MPENLSPSVQRPLSSAFQPLEFTTEREIRLLLIFNLPESLFLVHTTKSQLKPEVNLLHDTTNGYHCYLSCMFLSHSLQLITTLEIKHQAICTFSLKIHFNFLLLELPCPLPHLLSASLCSAHTGYTWGVWWVTQDRENIITIETTQDWRVWCNYIQKDVCSLANNHICMVKIVTVCCDWRPGSVLRKMKFSSMCDHVSYMSTKSVLNTKILCRKTLNLIPSIWYIHFFDAC